MRVCAFLLILSTAGIVSASAQSLADVARKESDRRQTVKDGGKTYTNRDLKPVPGAKPVTDDSSAATAAATVAADPDDAKDADGASKDDTTAVPAVDAKAANDGADTEKKDQAYWQKRMANLREQLDRDQTFLDALQSRVDSLTTDFVNRDDPAQRSQISSDRQKAVAELDRLKKALEQDKRAIPALEEEARREGVPAGWLR